MPHLFRKWGQRSTSSWLDGNLADCLALSVEASLSGSMKQTKKASEMSNCGCLGEAGVSLGQGFVLSNKSLDYKNPIAGMVFSRTCFRDVIESTS